MGNWASRIRDYLVENCRGHSGGYSKFRLQLI